MRSRAAMLESASKSPCDVRDLDRRCGVFCPNCGTQNPDSAQTCSKCNFNIKGAAAPKFKGTMLMMNQPIPGAPPGVGPQAAPAPAAPAPTPPPAAAVAPV